MIPSSILLIKNFIKVYFILVNIQLISSSKLTINHEKNLNNVVDNYYELTSIAQEKIENEKYSRLIVDNFLYNELFEFKARVNQDIDQVMFNISPETINYVKIFVNNDLVDPAFDYYNTTSKIYTIQFTNKVLANSSLHINIDFQRLSLLTLKDLYQLNGIAVTDHGSIDFRTKSLGISQLTYLLVTFMSRQKFTTVMKADYRQLKFKYNYSDIKDNSLLKIVYEIKRFFKLLFGENYQLPSIDASFKVDSWINKKFFNEINAVSTQVLIESKTVLDENRKQQFTSNLLHEWSYMYLNLLRPNLKANKWIIEGLAIYLKYYGILKYEPISKIHRKFIENQLQPALTADVLKQSIMSMALDEIPANTLQNRNEIINSKTSSLFRMFHLTFGLPALKQAIQNFYERGKVSRVTLNDFCNFLQNEIFFIEDFNLFLSILTLMKSWIEQAGYPILTVNVKGDNVELCQSRFSWQDVNNVDQSDHSVWWIPITWITKKTLNLKSTTPVYWFNTTQDKIMIPNEVNHNWIIFNTARTGFYRVNYDKDSWKRILDTLNSNTWDDIPMIDRMVIIDDIINLAKTGHISVDIYLRGLEYIRRETYSGPLKIVLKEFINLHEYYSDSKGFGDIDEFIFHELKWAYNSIEYTKKMNDSTSLISFQHDLTFLIDDIKLKKCVHSAQDYWKYIFKNTKISEKIKNKNHDYCLSINKKLQQYSHINLDKLSSLSAVERPLSELLLFCTHISSHQNKLLTLFQAETKINDVLNAQLIEKITVTMKNIGNCRNNGIQLVLNYLVQYPTLIDYYCKNNQSLFLDLISSFSQKLIKPTITLKELEKLTNISSYECSQVAKYLSIVRENKEFENKFYEKNHNLIVEWVKKYNDDVKKYGFYNYLLRNDIIPIHYVIELTPHMIPENFYFDGKVIITAIVQQETSEICIHFHNLTYNSINIEVDGQDVIIARIEHYKEYQYLKIYLNVNLEVQSFITIQIQYRGHIGQEKRGLYRDFYIDDLNQIKWYAATDLERASARRLFPCFDDPFFKAIFQLSINRTAEFRTVSNIKLKEVIKDNDRYIDIFERTSQISTHQIAFVLSEFNSSDQVSKNFTWFNENPVLELVYPIIQTKTFFEKIEQLVNPEEPYDYTYHDELAQLKNQVENYGLIMYKKKNVITNPNNVSLFDTLTYIINWNYEMMYRFFRNYLFMDFWRCEWFNRALSYHFLSVGYENNVNSKTEGNALFIVHHLQPSMLMDASSLSTTFIQEDYTPEQINNAYNQLTDDKGASILRMIEDTSEYLDTVHFFEQFVSNVVSKKKSTFFYIPKWGECPVINQFCKMIETKKIENSTTYSNCILNTWFSQKGFPVVHVKIKNNIATISQLPFQYNLVSQVNSQSLWDIPITWTSSVNPDFLATKRIFFLKKHKDSFEIDKIDSDGWVIFNLQQIGYYRVNYDSRLWNQIIVTFKSPSFVKIHQNNRAAIIDDLFNLARGGYVNYTLALSMAEYLIQEKNYAPWRAALINFSFLDKRLAVNVHVYKKFKAYVKMLIRPAYEKLGFHEEDDEGYSTSLLRINILEWACKYEYSSCISNSKLFFNRWMNDSNNFIPVNIQSIVYCTTISSGNKTDWLLLFKIYKKTNYQSEKNRIIKALTCTRQSELLQKLLLHSITKNSKLKIQESLDIFSAVYSSSDDGVKTTLTFISTHYSSILNYFGSYNIIKDILKGLVVHITTPVLVEAFQIFLQNFGEEFLPIKETILLCIAQVKEEMLWHNTYFSTISKFLKEINYSLILDPNDFNNILY